MEGTGALELSTSKNTTAFLLTWKFRQQEVKAVGQAEKPSAKIPVLLSEETAVASADLDDALPTGKRRD